MLAGTDSEPAPSPGIAPGTGSTREQWYNARVTTHRRTILVVEDDEDLAASHREADAVEHPVIAVGDDQVANLDDRFGMGIHGQMK